MSVTAFQFINLEYLETMTDGDAEMMRTMLDMLCSEIPEEVEKMQNFCAEGNWEEVFQVSHKLKTTLAFVGNEEVINLNKTVEHCTRNQVDLKEVPALVEQIAALSKNIVAELQTIP